MTLRFLISAAIALPINNRWKLLTNCKRLLCGVGSAAYPEIMVLIILFEATE
jgi:hypothetical protein